MPGGPDRSGAGQCSRASSVIAWRTPQPFTGTSKPTVLDVHHSVLAATRKPGDASRAVNGGPRHRSATPSKSGRGDGHSCPTGEIARGYLAR